MLKLPSKFEKIKLRRLSDNSYMIPRANKKVIEWLDKNAIRIINELRWFEIPTSCKKLKNLECIFKGTGCYIIGKGSSLDYLTENDFESPIYPILAINESIRKVEEFDLINPIFSIQQDSALKDSCLPKNGDIITSHQAAQYYEKYDNKYIYVPARFLTTPSNLTVTLAIEIAKKLGTIKIILLCFDACVNAKVTYAKCIGYESKRGGDPNRFLRHRKIIEKHLKNISVEWIIPEAPH